MSQLRVVLLATPLLAISNYCATLPPGAPGFGVLLGQLSGNRLSLRVACVGPSLDVSGEFSSHMKSLAALAALEMDVYPEHELAGLFVLRSPRATLDDFAEVAYKEFLQHVPGSVEARVLLMVDTTEVATGHRRHQVLSSVSAVVPSPTVRRPLPEEDAASHNSWGIRLELEASEGERAAAFTVVRNMIVSTAIASPAAEQIERLRPDETAVDAALETCEPLLRRSVQLVRMVSVAERFKATREAINSNGECGHSDTRQSGY